MADGYCIYFHFSPPGIYKSSVISFKSTSNLIGTVFPLEGTLSNRRPPLIIDPLTSCSENSRAPLIKEELMSLGVDKNIQV